MTSLVTTPLVVVTVRVSVVMMSRMRFCPFLLQLQVSGRPCPQIDCVSVVVMTFLIRMFGEPSKVTVVARSTMGEVYGGTIKGSKLSRLAIAPPEMVWPFAPFQ